MMVGYDLSRAKSDSNWKLVNASLYTQNLVNFFALNRLYNNKKLSGIEHNVRQPYWKYSSQHPLKEKNNINDCLLSMELEQKGTIRFA